MPSCTKSPDVIHAKESGTVLQVHTTAILPKGVRLNFTLDFDGSYYAAGDYSLSETADGYVLYNSKAGKIWSFNVAGKLTSIEETDGNTINCTYSGGKLTEISGDAGSFMMPMVRY